MLKHSKFHKLIGNPNSAWLPREMVTMVLQKVLPHIPVFQAPVSLIQLISYFLKQKLSRI